MELVQLQRNKGKLLRRKAPTKQERKERRKTATITVRHADFRLHIKKLQIVCRDELPGARIIRHNKQHN